MKPARLAAAFAILAAAAASAQEPAQEPPKKDEPKKQETIEVTADAIAERRDSTAAKIVVNRDEIVKYGDQTVLDVMKRLPGVTVSGAGGRGSEIRMRGLGNGYTQILVNGERAPAGFNLDDLSPDLIERIEVYRGAVAEYSTLAIAGTINIVLRQKPSTRQRELKLATSVENGRWGGNVTAQVADKSGTLSYTLPFVLNRFAFENHPVSEQLGVDASGVPHLRYVTAQLNRGEGEGVNTAPRVTWDFSKDHSATLEGFLNHSRFRGDFSDRAETTLGTPPLYARNDIGIDNDFTSARMNLRWARKLPGEARIEAKAGWFYNHRNGSVLWDAFDDAGTFILHRTVDSHFTDNGVNSTGKYLLPFVPGHAIAAGWDVSRNSRLEDRLQKDFTPTGLPQFNIDESYDARVIRLAAFAQDEWDVTPRFSLYTGLRWEGIDTRNVGNVVSEVHNRSGVWTPIAQALWKPPGTAKDQLRGSLARTYKAPGTTDLIPRRFINNNNTPTTPDFEGNPQLRPELAWGLDVAYEHYFSAGGVAGASAFARRIDDLILRELINRNGTWITRPANVGTARAFGIEMDVKASLRTFWPEGPATDIRATFNRNWSRVDEIPGPHNRLDAQTPFSANLGFDHKLAAPPLAIGGNFAFKTGGPVRTSATQARYAYARRNLDLYGVWTFSPAVKLRLTATNLLAQDFLDASAFYDAGGGTLTFTTLNPTYRRLGLALEIKL